MSDSENKDADLSPEPEENIKKPVSMDVGGGDNSNSKEEVKNDMPAIDSPPSSEPNTPNKNNTPVTSPKKSKKKKVVTSPDEEEELPPGLLERPVIIESGKRERKKTDRLPAGGNFTPSQKKKIEIPEGKGTKLGECPRIEQKLQQNKADDLKFLHRLLFNRQGSAQEIKKNIKQFCGYAFESGDKEYDKKMAVINKCTISQLKSACGILDLERTGQKVDIVYRLMAFLLHPENSGKPLPKPKPKRSSSGKKAKGEKRKRSSKKEGKKTKSKEDVDLSDDDDDEEDNHEDKSADDDENVSEEEEEEEVAPPKKKVKHNKTPKKVKPKADKSKENGKKEKAAKKKKVVVESDDESSDDEPLSKISSEPPTNSEIKVVIEKILDGADLEEVTMKTVVKQVYAKYPSFDLSDRKDFIKSTVKQIIS
ncbi:protein DEK [Patella vulgata]|uniref:protein DEK n=1 Tax=Patella vulgata TaxID=6465 RepID=UPI00217FBB89|nr:protein DEK [Patella vulgata]